MPAVHSFNVCIFESEKKATRVAHACLTIYRLPSYFFEKKFCSRLAVKSKPRLSKPVQTFHDTFRIPTYRSGDIEIELFARMKSFDVSTLWFFSFVASKAQRPKDVVPNRVKENFERAPVGSFDSYEEEKCGQCNVALRAKKPVCYQKPHLVLEPYSFEGGGGR